MHSDEGTIHAWLDGELSPEEAAALEAHVAGCTDCAALVAEARGVMAASSRILSALDQVPGGVLPRAGARPPSLTVERALPAPASPRRRVWWRSTQFAAAATLLVMAAGTWGVMRRVDPTAPATTAMPDELSRAGDAPGRATPESVAEAPPVALTAPAPAVTREAAPQPPMPAADAAQSPARARSSDNMAAASVPAAPPPPASRPLVAATAAPAESAVVGSARGAEKDEVMRKSSRVEAAVTQERARVEGEVRAQLATPAPAAAGTNAAERREAVLDRTARGVGPGALRCLALARRPDAERAGVPATVQLTDVSGPTVAGRRLKVVMSPAGAGWFWWTAPDGALVLVRVAGEAVTWEQHITGPAASDVVATERPCPGAP